MALEEIPNGPTTRYWLEYSQKNEVYVVFFVMEKSEGRVYQSAVVTGPAGYVGKYRKRHLWHNEKLIGATPGENDFILETPWGRFGLLICFDIWFGHVEEYKSKKVDGIIFLTDWDEGKR